MKRLKQSEVDAGLRGRSQHVKDDLGCVVAGPSRYRTELKVRNPARRPSFQMSSLPTLLSAILTRESFSVGVDGLASRGWSAELAGPRIV